MQMLDLELYTGCLLILFWIRDRIVISGNPDVHGDEHVDDAGFLLDPVHELCPEQCCPENLTIPDYMMARAIYSFPASHPCGLRDAQNTLVSR